ncbi:MAG: type II toxin-antitoxin system VapC family toxin [Candidatus Limnocylindrales bacterium]|nr:type II toxin-antitoxin system VapC family toxin [Candidatus Limnocylindrales bacterium]
MRFWDSSALVPLLVNESSSQAVLVEYERDPEVVAWWGTELECVSALAHLEREGILTAAGVVDALERLDALSLAWREVQPVARVGQIAVRVLRVHPLRAADALQLGAAIVAAEEQPSTLPLVTLDERLAQAGQREGFVIVRPDRAA